MHVTPRFLKHSHESVINDVQFDFYGKRIATVSHDRSMKIWDIDSHGDWYMSADCRFNNFVFTRLSWAHPEFGQIIVSCSFSVVCVWEEQECELRDDFRCSTSWSVKFQISDSRFPIVDVKFAPQHLGLRFASVSQDGIIRVYEPSDASNLTYWPLLASFDPFQGHELRCLSWNSTFQDLPSILIGSSIGACIWTVPGTILPIQSHKDCLACVWAPNNGRSRQTLAAAFRGFGIRIYSFERGHSNDISFVDMPCNDSLSIYFNVFGNSLSVAEDNGNDQDCISIYRKNVSGEWKKVQLVFSDDNEEITSADAKQGIRVLSILNAVSSSSLLESKLVDDQSKSKK